MPSGQFSVGDRIELVKPFKRGEPDIDAEIQRDLIETYGTTPITGAVVQDCAGADYVVVKFDLEKKMKSYSYNLYVDEDVLAPEMVVTEEDVQEAIRSILGE